MRLYSRLYSILRALLNKIERTAVIEPITSAEINTAFGVASGTGSNSQDYVIEYSNNTGNGYAKWASGKLECWIHDSQTMNLTTQWGSGGIYYGYINGLNFPVTFKSPSYPTIIINASASSGSVWVGPDVDSTVSSTGKIYVYTVGIHSDLLVYFSVYVVGQWK